jgi:hypothetical protein
MRGLVFVSLFVGNTAWAQSFEDTVAAAQQQAGDLTRYQQALQNPDQRMQYALVQQMLVHSDPAIQRIAKEHALFSTNPVMREAAVKAILDAGSTLRFQVAVTSELSDGVASWLNEVGGVFDAGRGEALIAAPPAVDSDCWGTKKGSCTFQQVGNTLQYNYRSIRVVVTLGNDGILRGSLTYDVNRRINTAQVQIDLKQ